jgi:hypothetical protein
MTTTARRLLRTAMFLGTTLAMLALTAGNVLAGSRLP